MTQQIATSIEVVTPDVARNWLSVNTANRAINKKLVDRLSSQMKRGEFVTNGEAIIFSDDNRLIDGQHRLNACVLSGVSFRSVVVRGVHHNAFYTIDTGSARTAADALQILGSKNAAQLAAAAKAAIVLDSEHPNFAGFVPHSEIIDWIEKNSDIRDWTSWFCANSKNRALAEPSLLISISCLASRRFDPERVRHFFQSCHDGIGLDKTDPAYVLRERLIANRTGKSRLPKRDVAALIIKALLYQMAGKKMTLLRWSPNTNEPFPMIKAVE
jgi:hypothetical protein